MFELLINIALCGSIGFIAIMVITFWSVEILEKLYQKQSKTMFLTALIISSFVIGFIILLLGF